MRTKNDDIEVEGKEGQVVEVLFNSIDADMMKQPEENCMPNVNRKG